MDPFDKASLVGRGGLSQYTCNIEIYIVLCYGGLRLR